GSVAAWARKNDVARRTAFYWAKEPGVRAEVAEVQRQSLARAIGRMNSRANKAADAIFKLAEVAESESVQLNAWRAILADQMAIAKFSALESRLQEVEKLLQDRDENANRPGNLPAS